MKMWLSNLGPKPDIFLPVLGHLRPFSGRCCQSCTPCSWGGFYTDAVPSLGLRDITRVTEEDTRFRGWLVRRICGVLVLWDRSVPKDTPGDLPAQVCCSERVRDVTLQQCGGDDDSDSQPWMERVRAVLGDIQAPLCLLALRFCHWALLHLLRRLFLSVQLHRGQLEMVLRAARTPDVPLVFLSTHKSPWDGPLLSFLLFSQGMGVPRVTVGDRLCSPPVRAALARLGGVFLPAGTEGDDGLPVAVLTTYLEEVLRSRQPLLIFLEEPPATTCLSAPARRWLAALCRALRDSAVPDVLVVPVGIAYDLVPGGWQWEGARGARPLGVTACLWAVCQALRRNLGCARVDFAQPFSLRVWQRGSHWCPPHPGEVITVTSVALQTPVGRWRGLGCWGTQCSPVSSLLDASVGVGTQRGDISGTSPPADAVSCSAVTAVAMTSALLLHKHREGVFLSRLMRDFSWLLEEVLLHQRDVGFSGQLRALVFHSLVLLREQVTIYRLSPIGDVLVVPEASQEALRELGHHSAAVLSVFASEAVGACAIHALLREMLPFLGPTPRIVLSHNELHRKALELLRLLPPNLLGLQPCQPLDCCSQDIIDKLVLCGLLEAEPDSKRWVCDLAPRCSGRGQPRARMDFSSDSDSEDEVPKTFFKLSEPQGCPGFLLFLCHLLRPVLRTYVRAVAFLDRPQWPQPGPPTITLALSSLQTFKEMGVSVAGLHRAPPLCAMCPPTLCCVSPPSLSLQVLEEVRTPTGPLLHLTQPFCSSEARSRLAAFIQQFTRP
ncbi:GPAT2 acyltransferase, partial [Podargus strigoides]|nr:GPAT2 acyltransferase [Podargus strigoides]